MVVVAGSVVAGSVAGSGPLPPPCLPPVNAGFCNTLAAPALCGSAKEVKP